MPPTDIWLTRDDIEGLEELRDETILASCAQDAELGVIYNRIGEILLGNIVRLDLDESYLQICALANRTAAELLSPKISRIGYPDGIWARNPYGAHPPFWKKSERGEDSFSLHWAVTPAKRRSAMINTFAHVAQMEPELREGAKALLEYERAHNLITPQEAADYIDE